MDRRKLVCGAAVTLATLLYNMVLWPGSGNTGSAADPSAGVAQPAATSRALLGPPVIEGLFVNEELQRGGLTTHVRPALRVSLPDATQVQRLIARVGPIQVGEVEIAVASRASVSIPLNLSSILNYGEQRITVEAMPKNPQAFSASISEPAIVHVDRVGPRVQSVQLVGDPNGVSSLLVRFEQDDLNPAGLVAENFEIVRLAATHAGAPLRPVRVLRDRNLVRLVLSELVTGEYELVIRSVTDLAGNPLDGRAQFVFSSYPEPERAPQICFPDYVQRSQVRPTTGFNPGDHVETRVSRLYYYRDAHRVAQIVNRNVKSYNRAAVDQRRREAERSRERADELTDERRAKERDAVQAAQEARQAEQEVQQAESRAAQAAKAHDQAAAELDATTDDLEQVQADLPGLRRSRSSLQEQLASTDPQDPRRAQLSARIQDLSVQIESAERDASRLAVMQKNATERESMAAEALQARETELAAARSELAIKRNTEIAKREQWLQAEAKENRAHEDQFRKEVAAAHEDPDTFAPADLDSIDPVCQCSISVIGEGLIQIRGPIRGINKIRMMINQIDAPVGQVKVGIFTAQVNGEHGDRMEKVVGRIEGHIDLSRFLAAQSLLMLRKAVQLEASRVAQSAECGGHNQADRDRKYLYAFFGRDFIDELYRMDSELLHTDNKLLALNSMDSFSTSKALFVLALARNDVRLNILNNFMLMVDDQMPQIEYDYRRTIGLMPCKLNPMREIGKNVFERYRFRSLRGIFDSEILGPDTLNASQREFIRLAQIFKAQMIAEVELKQRVIERALIEDRANDDELRYQQLEPVHRAAISGVTESLSRRVEIEEKIRTLATDILREIAWIETIAPQKMRESVTVLTKIAADIKTEELRLRAIDKKLMPAVEEFATKPQAKTMRVGDSPYLLSRDPQDPSIIRLRNMETNWAERIVSTIETLEEARVYARLNSQQMRHVDETIEELRTAAKIAEDTRSLDVPDVRMLQSQLSRTSQALLDQAPAMEDAADYAQKAASDEPIDRQRILLLAERAYAMASNTSIPFAEVVEALEELLEAVNSENIDRRQQLLPRIREAYALAIEKRAFRRTKESAEEVARLTRQRLDQKKLLDFLIDEHEDKYIELLEGTRAHTAAMDAYLKRLAIALEDDIKVQFYDPAFVGIRSAAREWDVNLGQIERTTILTNNRAFAKVTPQATMEFDLPKRDILIQEAMKGAKAMVEDYGALLQDPTFLAATKMLSGSPPAMSSSTPSGPVPGMLNQGQPQPAVKTVLPGLPTSTEESVMNQTAGQERELGAAMEALIPDPAVYKFETGTGFEIRPVIQPDGDSVIYGFNYMYTTNVREPVRADEKHLGRVKRHFIDTQVQTSNFELREISRYQVALKASRTSRGVPLFEDIPGVGILFRPLPSDESSLQQNIIMGQSTVYPTLFDLMGLRWAPYIVDMGDEAIVDAEHVIRGRRQIISQFVFDEASNRVDGFLGIPDTHPELHRPDLYHRQRSPSPYHPSGYDAANFPHDPTGQRYQIRDPRPLEYRQPPTDPYHRRLMESQHGSHGETIIMPPEHAPLPNGAALPNAVPPPNVTPPPSASYSARPLGKDFKPHPSARNDKPLILTPVR